MSLSIIIAVAVGVIVFLLLVAVWYFIAVPSTRKSMAEEALKAAEMEAEVIKQKKMLEDKKHMKPQIPLLKNAFN